VGSYLDDADDFPVEDSGPRGPAILDGPGVDGWIEGGAWARVRSSNVAAVAYDPERRELRVRFLRHGAASEPVYRYDGVSEDVARQLFLAPSVGRFLAARVKGHYPHTKEG
jgi:hypothetical protein